MVDNPRSKIKCKRCGGDTDIVGGKKVCSDCGWTNELGKILAQIEGVLYQYNCIPQKVDNKLRDILNQYGKKIG